MTIQTLASLGPYFNDQTATPYGSDFAAHGLFRAILEYGDLASVYSFADPYTRSSLSSVYDDPRATTISELSLVSGIDRYQIDVWQNTDASPVPLYLRSAFGTRLFPFLSLSHIIVHPEFIRSGILGDMLLMPWEACDSHICTSNSVKNSLSESLAMVSEDLQAQTGSRLDFGGRLDVVPLGVDTERFAPRDKAAARTELGLALDELVILWFGRWSPTDKADLLPLLAVFRRLVHDLPRVPLRLVIAGTDVSGRNRFRPALEEYAQALGIAPMVSLLEGFSAERRHMLMSAADIFTSPIDSVSETFGLTPIEAMACGIPQVVSDKDGYRETVVDGETGYLIPTYWSKSSAADLSALGALPSHTSMGYHWFHFAQSIALDLDVFLSKLKVLIERPELRRSMGENARRRAVTFFGWKVIAKKYKELWTELASIAGRIAPQWRPRRMVFPLGYARRFGTCAKELLVDEDVVKITPAGVALLERDHPFPWHFEWERDLEFREQAARHKLECLRRDGEATFGRIADLTGDELDDARRRREVSWLLKHGFARLVRKS